MKKKIFGTYILTVSALLVVIALAIFLPQIIFYVQDSYQVNQVDVINRDVYDIMEMQTAYSADITTRLKKLAEVGYGNVTVSLVDKTIEFDEFYSILSEVRHSEYMDRLIGLSPDTFGDSMKELSAENLEECNRYIVYGPDYADGVILMFWYMKIFVPSISSYMELIIDSETHTIYYISVDSVDGVAFVADENGSIEGHNVVEAPTETIEEVFIYNTAQSEVIAIIAEGVPGEFASYYRMYYGAGTDAMSYAEDVRLIADNSVLSENAYTLAVPIEYDGISISLFFRFCAEAGFGQGPDISIGIPVIRHLVDI